MGHEIKVYDKKSRFSQRYVVHTFFCNLKILPKRIVFEQQTGTNSFKNWKVNHRKRQYRFFELMYSHFSNSRGGWNKRGGGAKVAKSINMEAGINMEGGIFWKKLVHKSNKSVGWNFSKLVSMASHLLERWDYIS